MNTIPERRLPTLLEPFAKEFEPYKLESVAIEALPTPKGVDLAFHQSKFSGLPYLPAEMPYPFDSHGNYMILVAQINFAEVPPLALYPTKGILQLFLPSTVDWYGTEDYRIYFHPEPDKPHRNDFSFLTDAHYVHSPVFCQHRLRFHKQVEYGSDTDHRFDIQLNNQSFADFCEAVAEAEQEDLYNFFSGEGHKIGGYAHCCQSDPRDYHAEDRSNDIQLLQIDTDKHIMFGDSGTAHIFIHPDHLVAHNFTNAWFEWDCY